MAVSLTFIPPTEITLRSDEIHFEAAESVGALTIGMCQQLEEAGCRFEVKAAGIEWKTSVAPDLGTILASIPTIIHDLSQGEFTELYFYEMERKLLLQPSDDVTQVRAIWVSPDPEVIDGAVAETILTRDLIRMLTDLCIGTATTIQAINPTLAALTPLPQWRQGDPGPPAERNWRPMPPKI